MLQQIVRRGGTNSVLCRPAMMLAKSVGVYLAEVSDAFGGGVRFRAACQDVLQSRALFLAQLGCGSGTGVTLRSNVIRPDHRPS
ncbi:hypothetical protein AAW14_00020 [Streptomyces hygroscopicus]|uniref:hypothetical protein n=1 Tax=Streptomyces hygroscopicus TaxID=1912 RepID=UPI003A101C72|nr:hypothetical protein [Streptomyces hygroscopicus]